MDRLFLKVGEERKGKERLGGAWIGTYLLPDAAEKRGGVMTWNGGVGILLDIHILNNCRDRISIHNVRNENFKRPPHTACRQKAELVRSLA